MSHDTRTAQAIRDVTGQQPARRNDGYIGAVLFFAFMTLVAIFLAAAMTGDYPVYSDYDSPPYSDSTQGARR